MKIMPGDILKVYCRKKLVWHFGIMTQFNTVIDMAPRYGIAERSFKEFSENEPVQIVPREHGDAPRHIILERAWSSIGSINYSAFWSNCEHFVNWCRKGKMVSKQLIIYLVVSSVIIGTLFLIIRNFIRRNP